MTDNNYGANAIKVMKGLDAIRKRPGMYTDTSTPNHIGLEVLDNSADEAQNGHGNAIKVIVHRDHSMSVIDTGRGIPFDFHEEEQKSAVEVIFTMLHAGGKFDNTGDGAYKNSGGLHGVGVTVTNALSEYVTVVGRTGNTVSQITFTDGVAGEIHVLDSNYDGPSGTTVTFKPDSARFENHKFNKAQLLQDCKAKAVLIKNLEMTVEFEQEDESLENEVHVFKYSKPLETHMNEVSKDSEPLAVYLDTSNTDDQKQGIDWYVAIKTVGSRHMESYVNMITTNQGGTHVNGFYKGVFSATKEYMVQNSLIPKNVELAQEDVTQHLISAISVRLVDPQFKNQTKDALQGAEFTQLVEKLVYPKFLTWLMSNYDAAKEFSDMIVKAAQARIRKNRTIETKRQSGLTSPLPDKLSDCLTKDPKKAEVFLVEGDSAGGSAKQGRDREYQAIMPMKGKITNCWDIDSVKAMSSDEVNFIATAIGVIPHELDSDPALVLANIRYHTISVLADADVDGYHIECLVTALFLTHFPHVLTQGHFCISQTPRFRVSAKAKGKKKAFSQYAKNDEMKDIVVERLLADGYKESDITVSRFKGLGEMNPSQLRETALDPQTRTMFRPEMSIADVQVARNELAKVFSDKKNKKAERKKWVSENADFSIYEPESTQSSLEEAKGKSELLNRLDNLEAFIDKTEDSYLAYAALTLVGRSLLHIQDGLKPSHRRSLYAMHDLGMKAGGGYKKSARIVGDTIGKYHPHGDSSVYDAMATLAQPWKARYPLIDGQGNWGSRDGDTPAAMRYTEAKPTIYADILQEEISKSAAVFVPNFDNTTVEPEYLPAGFPLVLTNGGEGVAVAMTSYVPPHNISEVINATVAYIENPDITTLELMEHLPGPDYPTGGQVISSKEDILKTYDTGIGTIKLRCRWEAENRARGKYVIHITELPYGVSAPKVSAWIAEKSMYEPKPNEKPEPKKIEIRNWLKANIADIKDISDNKENPIESKLLVEPVSCGRSPEEFMSALIATVPLLQKNENVKLNLVSIDYRPKTRALKEILADWVEFRRQTIERRSIARRTKLERRLEIVNGRLAVMDSIDRVIEIIRNEDDSLAVLMDEFSLTERQAADVLEIRLKELERLEVTKYLKEKEGIEKEIASLTKLLESKRRMNSQIVKELKESNKRMADERRTLIQEEKPVSFDISNASKSRDKVSVYLTANGFMFSRKGHDVEDPEKMLKPGDAFQFKLETRMDRSVIFMSCTGRAYTINAEDFPSGSNSVHISTLVSHKKGKIVKMLEHEEGAKFLMAQEGGYGFITGSEALYSQQRTGKEVFKNVGDDCPILLIEKLTEAQVSDSENQPAKYGYLNVLTNNSRLIQFPVDEIKEYPKSQGVKLLSLAKGEVVAEYMMAPDGEFILDGNSLELDIELFRKKRAATPRKLK